MPSPSLPAGAKTLWRMSGPLTDGPHSLHVSRFRSGLPSRADREPLTRAGRMSDDT